MSGAGVKLHTDTFYWSVLQSQPRVQEYEPRHNVWPLWMVEDAQKADKSRWEENNVFG